MSGSEQERFEVQVTIGAPVEAVFEPHDDAKVPFTLVQWRVS